MEINTNREGNMNANEIKNTVQTMLNLWDAAKAQGMTDAQIAAAFTAKFVK